MNQQREVIYSYRRSVLKGYSLKHEILEMIEETINAVIDQHIPEDSYPEDWNLERLPTVSGQPQYRHQRRGPGFRSPQPGTTAQHLQEYVLQAYETKEGNVGEETLRDIERRSMLEVVDNQWRDHLHEMDLLKEGVYLRAYANKDPLIEYKRESFDLFQSLITRIQEGVTRKVFTTYYLTQEQMDSLRKQANARHEDIDTFLQAKQQAAVNQNVSAPPQYSGAYDAPPEEKQRPVRVAERVGRNDPCPCGSGKKYKKCCGIHEGDEQ
jgi:preprotein translocase subunit SecA